MNPYHCCATCVHFRVIKTGSGSIRLCSRLKYETKPTYQFQCWEPNERVRKLMVKRNIAF